MNCKPIPSRLCVLAVKSMSAAITFGATFFPASVSGNKEWAEINSHLIPVAIFLERTFAAVNIDLWLMSF
jgi:hypothetical protein